MLFFVSALAIWFMRPEGVKAAFGLWVAVLGAYGYVSVQANSFDELARLNAQGAGLQTPQALEGLWNVSYLFPAFGFGLAAIFFLLVKINRKQTEVFIKANLGEISRDEAERQLGLPA